MNSHVALPTGPRHEDGRGEGFPRTDLAFLDLDHGTIHRFLRSCPLADLDQSFADWTIKTR